MIITRIILTLCLLLGSVQVKAEMLNYPTVTLRTLDKSTARTDTIDVNIRETVEFGSLFIKVQSCRKSEPLDKPESASFLQIWEVPVNSKKSEWVFSGWMFASSPAVSAMDHAVYDVWVLDCKGREETAPVTNSVKIEGETVPILPVNEEDDEATEGVDDAEKEGETQPLTEEEAPAPVEITAEDLNKKIQQNPEKSIESVIESIQEEDTQPDDSQYDNTNYE